ncbi:DCN1-like protein 4 [Psilocybe cubensis]|uniref:Defective in cullin neddylation protein n=2 Tax=Psilocybe cubensis TaxID=181762 RepID=A0A8H8CN50_PSICU|nr:DCN1-like protein 4 [Psilocybe cubensis]KAH9484085.1 DCN1-like protein 4 [Psilocybe cubensis]
MAPKRKHTDDSASVASSTRSTRAASKSTTAKNTAKDSAPSSSRKATHSGATEHEIETTTPNKRAKTTASTRKTTTRKSKVVDEPTTIGKPSSIKASEIPFKHIDTRGSIEPAPIATAKPPPVPKKPTKAEVYSPQRALELFDDYADSDNADVIGPEGFERICTDADMPLDGPRPIIFAWQMGAKDMAKISKDEWIKGTGTLKASSISQISTAIAELDDLLMQGKPPIVLGSNNQDYDRASYFAYSTNVKAAFQKLYLFSFTLVKPETSKNIDMEVKFLTSIFACNMLMLDSQTSMAFWTVLLAPKYPIMEDVIKFITEKGTYKATNKDLWSMMLEFCETVSPSLEDYEADGAWPTLLDDFVIWKKASTGKASNTRS